jgi:hypothetical protein
VFRSGVVLHVLVRAWGSPPAITVAQPVAPCDDISRARLSFPVRFTSISRTEYNQLTIDTAIVDTCLARTRPLTRRRKRDICSFCILGCCLRE